MPRTLIIGSEAARRHVPGWREPKDYDIFSDFEDSILRDCGMKRTDPFWDERFSEWIPDGTRRYATLDELYTIKRSHAYWDLHGWSKHMADMLNLQKAGAQLIPNLHDLLYQVWEDKHGKKIVDLTQEADEFFSDAVTRIYVHDSIHESVAYGDHPIYEDCLKDGHTVQMDMNKIRALPFDDQVKLFREEIYVTALERLMIPNNYRYSSGRAYQWALRRTITSLTKGWSARFLVEHFDVFRTPDVDYVAQHKSKSHKLIRLENQ